MSRCGVRLRRAERPQVPKGANSYQVSKETEGESSGSGDHYQFPEGIKNHGAEYWDELAGALLPPDLVRQAIDEEVKYVAELKVYTLVTLARCRQQGLVPVFTRWLYTNKDDLDMLEFCVRLVAQETRRVSELLPVGAAQTFAATPQI